MIVKTGLDKFPTVELDECSSVYCRPTSGPSSEKLWLLIAVNSKGEVFNIGFLDNADECRSMVGSLDIAVYKGRNWDFNDELDKIRSKSIG